MIFPLAMLAAAILFGLLRLAWLTVDLLIRRPRLGLFVLVLFVLAWAQSRAARNERAIPKRGIVREAVGA